MYAIRRYYDLAQGRDDGVGQGQDEEDRRAHAQTVLRSGGHGQGGAQAEHHAKRRQFVPEALGEFRITSYNVCYTKLLRWVVPFAFEGMVSAFGFVAVAC